MRNHVKIFENKLSKIVDCDPHAVFSVVLARDRPALTQNFNYRIGEKRSTRMHILLAPFWVPFFDILNASI